MTLLLPLLSTLLGGALNWLPEVFKYFQQKQANAHELAMMDKSMQAAKEQAAYKMAEIQETTASADFAAAHRPQISLGVQVLDAAKGWGVGAAWLMPVVYLFSMLDLLIGSVRPVVTYMVIWLYLWWRYETVKWFQKVNDSTLGEALRAAWTPDDTAIVFLVLGFWFGARIKQRADHQR